MSNCRFIFILCPERSGSTMLSYMLAASPAIVVPPELHLMAYPSLRMCFEHQPMARHSMKSLCDSLQMPPPTSLDMSPVDFYRSACEAGDLIGVKWIIDKTPRYSRFPETIKKTKETRDPFYIWLTRHPLGVLSSQIERINNRLAEKDQNAISKFYSLYIKEKIARISGYRSKKILRNWLNVNTNIELFLSGQEPWTMKHITYEQLVTDPDPILKEVCSELSISIDGGMYNPSKNTPSVLNWGIGDQKINSMKSIDPSRATAWMDLYKEDALSDEMKRCAAKWCNQGNASP